MKRIVMVDDDVDFCGATQILLESKGYEVFLAHDGKEGLEKVRAMRPDLVILDVMMPEMNGYDVCVVLKADPTLREIPVILLTGVDQFIFKTAYTPAMGLMTEADDYIAKPVESAELAHRVEQLLSLEG